MNAGKSLLSRVLEPEVMDSPDEARNYDEMDHAEVNRLFVSDFLAFADWGTSVSDEGAASGDEPFHEVLDIGTGTAQIPIELCRRGPRARVVAVDLAVSMLEIAAMNVDIAALRHRIMLDLVDAKVLSYGDGRFAAVISNSIVHHIPEPRDVLAEALRVVAPGGLVFVRDLMRPRDDAEVRSLLDTYAINANGHQRTMFEASLRASLDLEEMRELVTNLGYDPQDVTATSDRHWTWAVRRYLS